MEQHEEDRGPNAAIDKAVIKAQTEIIKMLSKAMFLHRQPFKANSHSQKLLIQKIERAMDDVKNTIDYVVDDPGQASLVAVKANLIMASRMQKYMHNRRYELVAASDEEQVILSEKNYQLLAMALDIGFARAHAERVVIKLVDDMRAIPGVTPSLWKEELYRPVVQLARDAISLVQQDIAPNESMKRQGEKNMRDNIQEIQSALEARGLDKSASWSVLEHIVENLKNGIGALMRFDDAKLALINNSLDMAKDGQVSDIAASWQSRLSKDGGSIGL